MSTASRAQLLDDGPQPAVSRAVPRRDANKLAKRARIVAAAREEFRTKGFHDAKLSDVARAAEVAKGTLFLYAGSKEELLWLVLGEDLQPLLESLDPRPDRPLRTRLLEHFEFAGRLQQRYPELARVAAKELTWANPPSTTTLEFIDQWLSKLANVLDSGKATGEIDRAHSADLLSRLLTDVYFGTAQTWLTGRSSFEAASERLVRSIDLILTGAAPDTAPSATTKID